MLVVLVDLSYSFCLVNSCIKPIFTFAVSSKIKPSKCLFKYNGVSYTRSMNSIRKSDQPSNRWLFLIIGLQYMTIFLLQKSAQQFRIFEHIYILLVDANGSAQLLLFPTNHNICMICLGAQFFFVSIKFK